ncbi:CAP domain-containing protein [Mariannaea sp. PMI_226]|nr:CAP domain-containing protein [Mariannaea sp. PMI_226]
MKASIFLAGASAMLACASPIHKRAYHTKWVTDFVTVTVIAGQEPTVPPAAPTTEVKIQEAPAPAPTTTIVKKPVNDKLVAAPPVVKTTVVVPAQPTTTKAAVVKAPAPSVAVKEVTSKAPAPEKPKTTAASPPPSSGSSSGSDSDIDLSLSGSYSSVMTNYHNVHRANHSVSAVTWNSDLADWAMVLAQRCKFEHDITIGGQAYGQNIAATGRSDLTESDSNRNKLGAVSVTEQWYNSEMPNWSFYGQENPPAGMDLDLFGHFTQVVWEGSHEIGCATAWCPSGTMYSGGMNAYFTVCNYQGPGNYGGQYGKNVLPPLGHKRVTV